MRLRTTLFFSFLLCIVTLPYSALSQGNQGGIDAVGIPTKYYNSIVKILLYDSASKNPDKAYLGRGSGFFVTKDGYIFTNRHVIDWCYHGFYRYTTYNQDDKKYEDHFAMYTPAALSNPDVQKITYVGHPSVIVQVFTNVKGDSFKLYHAQVVALDTDHFDGAILKINSDLKGNAVSDVFHPVPIGNSDSINQGQDLCLIGFPAQYEGTFDEMLKDLSTLLLGKHSGYDFKYNPTFGFIKTDAKINSGNSGGPVFGPGNKVIGLATAAFDLTSVGLIGGIDAMYYLASVVPGLTVPGLAPPSKAPAFSTAAPFKPLPLPTAKQIKRANNMAGKTGLANSKAYLMIGVEYGVSVTSNYDFGGMPTNNDYTNPSQPSVSGNEYRASLRIVKPTFLKQRNNLVGYFFNLEPGVVVQNWDQSTQFIKPKPGNPATVVMNGASGDVEPNLYFSFGFSYTYLFTHDIGITAYYGPAIDISVPGNNMNIGMVDSAGFQSNISYQRNISIVQTAGLAFKLKVLYLALDFHFANSFAATAMVPQQITQGNTNGNLINMNGNCNRSAICLVLGVCL